jgi:hypothetical protein
MAGTVANGSSTFNRGASASAPFVGQSQSQSGGRNGTTTALASLV